MRPFTMLSGLAALLLVGCNPDTAAAIPVPAAPVLSVQTAGSRELVGYTQNVYPGADLDMVLANPTEENLLTALQQFAFTNWAERAAAIARFVDQNNPDVVALNERSKVIVGGFGAPLDTHTDVLPILLSAPDKRGLHYVVAGKVANLHPVLNLGGPGVSLGGFATFDLIRGYVLVDITDGTRTVRFAASHVEDQALELNLAQSAELMGMLANSPEPIVIARDLNTDPADPAPTSYRNFEE